MGINEIITEGCTNQFSEQWLHEVDTVVEASDLREIYQVLEEVDGRFDKSPNVSRPRVASRIVSRDATRCYYCKEPGHISRFCERQERMMKID